MSASPARAVAPSPKVKRKFSAEEKAAYYSELASSIGNKLKVAAREQGSIQAEGEAEQILRCAKCGSEGNTWIGEGFETVTGDLESPLGADVELWDGYGRLWNCNSRLCPACSAKSRKRGKKKLLSVLGSHKMRVGYAYRFVTLTQPVLPEKSLTESMEILDQAWDLFSRRKFWKLHVRGGFIAQEFEPSKSGPGFHVHFHMIVESKFIPVGLLIEEWETCVTKAQKGHSRDSLCECGHERKEHESGPCVVSRCGCQQFHYNASVSVKLVRDREGEGITWVSQRKAVEECLKYVVKPQSWLKMASKDLVECATVTRWPRMLECFGSLKATSRQAQSTIVHAKRIIRRKREPGDEGDEDLGLLSRKRERATPLRKLLGAIPYDRWLEELDKRVKEARIFRIAQLKERYPRVRFSLLQDYVNFDGQAAYTKLCLMV